MDSDFEGSETESRVSPFQVIFDKDESKEGCLASERITLPILTKYEKTKILALRAAQIQNQSAIYVSIAPFDLEQMTALEIAERELMEKRIPLTIRRYLPDNTYEQWNLE